jgi:hypothetical protein
MKIKLMLTNIICQVLLLRLSVINRNVYIGKIGVKIFMID